MGFTRAIGRPSYVMAAEVLLGALARERRASMKIERKFVVSNDGQLMSQIVDPYGTSDALQKIKGKYANVLADVDAYVGKIKINGLEWDLYSPMLGTQFRVFINSLRDLGEIVREEQKRRQQLLEEAVESFDTEYFIDLGEDTDE